MVPSASVSLQLRFEAVVLVPRAGSRDTRFSGKLAVSTVQGAPGRAPARCQGAI